MYINKKTFITYGFCIFTFNNLFNCYQNPMTNKTEINLSILKARAFRISRNKEQFKNKYYKILKKEYKKSIKMCNDMSRFEQSLTTTITLQKLCYVYNFQKTFEMEIETNNQLLLLRNQMNENAQYKAMLVYELQKFTIPQNFFK